MEFSRGRKRDRDDAEDEEQGLRGVRPRLGAPTSPRPWPPQQPPPAQDRGHSGGSQGVGDDDGEAYLADDDEDEVSEQAEFEGDFREEHFDEDPSNSGDESSDEGGEFLEDEGGEASEEDGEEGRGEEDEESGEGRRDDRPGLVAAPSPRREQPRPPQDGGDSRSGERDDGGDGVEFAEAEDENGSNDSDDSRDDDSGDDDDDDSSVSSFDSCVGFGKTEEAFDERGGALLAELREREQGRRGSSSDPIPLLLSVEGTADLVRRYGGDGSVLWRPVISRDDPRPLFEACCKTMSRDEMAELLRRLLSFLPNLLSRRDCYRGLRRGGPGRLPRLSRSREETLLHLAVRTSAPLETIRLIAGEGRDALLIPDRRGRLPVHTYCHRRFSCDRNLPYVSDRRFSFLRVRYIRDRRFSLLSVPYLRSLVDANGTALRTTTKDGRLPLHLAAATLGTCDRGALEAIQWMIEAHPGAGDSESLRIALDFMNWPAPLDDRALDLLLRMIELAPLAARKREEGLYATALHRACYLCPYVTLVSTLALAGPNTLSVLNCQEEFPLHIACKRLLDSARSVDHVRDVIQLLMAAYPPALKAIDQKGKTPIMNVIASVLNGVERSPPVLQLLLDMIREGGPRSLWSVFNKPFDHFRVDRRYGEFRIVVTTAVELACAYRWGLEILSPLMEAHPAALCMSLMGEDTAAEVRVTWVLPYLQLNGSEHNAADEADRQRLRQLLQEINGPNSFVARSVRDLPADVAGAVLGAGRDAFLAAAEVLIHDSTRRAVPIAVRTRVRQILYRHVPPDVVAAAREEGGSAFALVRSVHEHVLGEALGQLRSEVLRDEALQSFLRSSQDFQDMISGVYRMNRAGRLEGPTAGGGAAAGLGAAAGGAAVAAAERQARVLAAAGDNASCLFLHLRESPALFGVVGDNGPAAAGAGAVAAP